MKIMCVRFLSAGWSVVNFIVALTYGNVATGRCNCSVFGEVSQYSWFQRMVCKACMNS